ncbi:MAG: class I mannose-6-phosphate isomerase [Lachnospiraceae bacterium]
MDQSKSSHSYVIFPNVQVSVSDYPVSKGVEEIGARLLDACQGRKKTVVTVECYPGVNQEEVWEIIRQLPFVKALHSDDLAFEPEKMDALLEAELTEDSVFGIMTGHPLMDYFYPEKIAAAQKEVDDISEGIVLIYGVGASLIHSGDILIVADITRWEIQLRYRRGMANWRTARQNCSKQQKYKRGYFAEWRWADQRKDVLLPVMHFYLDMTTEGQPAMVDGASYRNAMGQVAAQPFRMVPYFDPGVWGGDWMKTHFHLPENGSNYAWSFDGVPEENSLLLDFGGKLIQTPALNLVYLEPCSLLGERVYRRFGKEFPIRFDLLDTIHGQNLSLQVHPLLEYIQEHFHMTYTQDESYYILDTEGDSSYVYLGIKTGTNPEEMKLDLEAAQRGEKMFPAESYVNRIPVKKHDHVLIPAGTVHCSGAGTMVLEVSATPYIFTFKMWDWGRLDLDGKPRPIHLQRGLDNIQWERSTEWVQSNLIAQTATVYQEESSLIERTGLHELEFIDTYRVSTTSRVLIPRNGSVHVLNLVEGEYAVIVSETDAFAPFELHYAETCILPEAAGDYHLLSDGALIRVIIACVRESV